MGERERSAPLTAEVREGKLTLSVDVEELYSYVVTRCTGEFALAGSVLLDLTPKEFANSLVTYLLDASFRGSSPASQAFEHAVVTWVESVNSVEHAFAEMDEDEVIDGEEPLDALAPTIH